MIKSYRFSKTDWHFYAKAFSKDYLVISIELEAGQGDQSKLSILKDHLALL
jgi:hypothetical protein